MYSLPFILIIGRALLGIVFLVGFKYRILHSRFLLFFLIGAISDILDGLICRIYGSSHYPLTLSELDSFADGIFYFSSLAYLLFNLRKELLKSKSLLIIMICFQLLSWIFSFVKFGAFTSYHPISAKIWGILIILSVVEICIRKKSRLIIVMCLMGIICISEEICITYILPVKKDSVTSIFKAIKLANEYKSSKFAK